MRSSRWHTGDHGKRNLGFKSDEGSRSEKKDCWVNQEQHQE